LGNVLLAGQGLIVNEASQGTNGGSSEIYELVVVGAPCETVDLRGWIIDDNNGDFSALGWPLKGMGVARGHARFTYDDVWSSVPVGTIILLQYATSNTEQVGDESDADCDYLRVLELDVQYSSGSFGCDSSQRFGFL